jgi:hypothetical protein
MPTGPPCCCRHPGPPTRAEVQKQGRERAKEDKSEHVIEKKDVTIGERTHTCTTPAT